MSAQKKLQEEDRSNEIIKIRDMLSMGDTTVQMGNEMRAIPREKWNPNEGSTLAILPEQGLAMKADLTNASDEM